MPEVKTIRHPIRNGETLRHDGPLFIDNTIGDNAKIYVTNGGVFVRINENPGFKVIGHNVQIHTTGDYDPKWEHLRDMPRETARDERHYRQALREHFEEKHRITDIPFSGIRIGNDVSVGGGVKLIQEGTGSIRCLSPTENLYVRTESMFTGGDAVKPNVKAGIVNMGYVKRGKITSGSYMVLDRASHSANLTAATWMEARRLETCFAIAGERITYGSGDISQGKLTAPIIEEVGEAAIRHSRDPDQSFDGPR